MNATLSKANFLNIKFVPLAVETRSHIDLAMPHGFFSHQDAILQFCAQTPDANTASEIRFIDCQKFRIGHPNDEGFYSNGMDKFNSSIYNIENFPDLEFYQGFFEVIGTNVNKTDQLHGGFISNQPPIGSNSNDCRHFAFFMKDATFECFAGSYEETRLFSACLLNERHAEYT